MPDPTADLREEAEELQAHLDRRRDELGIDNDTDDADGRGPLADDLQDRVEELARHAAEHPPDDFDVEDAQDELRAQVQEQQATQRRSLWRKSIPARFVDATTDDLDGAAADLAARWDGQANVLLLGAVGVGKTHAAVAIARTAHDDGARVAFWPVVELLDAMRPGGSETALLRAVNADVLVLDDLGAEKPSDWTAQQLYAVVNRRWLECRPTVVTSNLAPDDLEAAVGERMWSRLYHDALRLKLAGDDRRTG